MTDTDGDRGGAIKHQCADSSRESGEALATQRRGYFQDLMADILSLQQRQQEREAKRYRGTVFATGDLWDATQAREW